MRWKTELHVHTIYSPDSLLAKIPLLLMCKIKGIKCIAITDHNSLCGAVKYEPFFAKHGVKVIIGEEIMTSQGEIIGLFLKNVIPPGLSPEETVRAIKKQGGLVCIPHPFDPTRAKTVLSNISSVAEDVHMIECSNGRNRKIEFDRVQEEICEKFNRQKVVGSDAHTFFEIGRNYAWLLPFETPEQFLKNLSHATRVTARIRTYPHTITKFVRAVRMLRKGDFGGLYRAFRKRR
ncbi:MAG: PHP domain-containing protein [Defluviitaleaceae bacterium]|nr:PHP domain-containing protein [Defluviitaleaceae bacterium]